MNKRFTTTLVAAIGVITAPGAFAWDEDTCSTGSISGSVPDGGTDGGAATTCTATDAGTLPGTTNCYRDPTCANPNPTMGPMNSALPYDHATAHYEMTYLLARCVGYTSTDAVQIAAADAATDMSSPYCGSQSAALSAGSFFYYNAYSCGYDANATNNRGNLSESATPYYPTDATHPALRWAHTDRCTRESSSVTQGVGHGEFFHYPYWETSAGSSTNSLSTLRAWALGSATTLIDPAARNSSGTITPCDMAYLPGTTGAPVNACATPTALSARQYNSGSALVCNYTTSSEWTMPAPASGSDPTKVFRLGVYLHSVGDSYSHYTCQELSGQPIDSTTGNVHVNVTSGAATTHATSSYQSTTRCGTDSTSTNGRPSGTTYNQCVTACDLVAHDLEWGDSSVQQMADAHAVSLLQIRARGGLMWVWDQLATARGRSSRDNSSSAVRSFRTSVPTGYSSHYDAIDRQNYVRSQISLGTSANNYTADSPCLCPNGMYDWVTDTSTTGGHCATIDTLRASTGSTVATAQSTQVTARTVRIGTPVRLYAYADSHRINGTREDVAVSSITNWVSSSTAIFTVDNSTTSGNIGTVTAVAVGTATLTLRRLGVTTTVAITVTN